MRDIDDNLIALLEHRDPAQRKKAVQALAQTRNPDALPYLMVAYKSDADPHVRELAHKAGVYIRKNAPASSSSANASASTTPGVITAGVITQTDREWAETFLRQALDRHMRGDDEFAYRNVLKALKRNPDLQTDAETLEIVARITEKPEDEAIAYLLEWEARALRNAGKHKWVSDDSYRGVVVNLAIYWLVNMGLVLVGFFLVLSLVSVSDAFNNPQFQGAVAINRPEDIDPSALVSSLATAFISNGLAISALLPYAMLDALRSVLSLLIVYFAIHMISVLILNGEGTLPRLIRLLTPFMSIMFPLLTVLVVAVILIPIAFPDLSGIMRIIPIIYLFVLGFGTAASVSRAYRFDIGRGCISLVLTGAFFMLMGCSLSVLWFAFTGGR